MTGLSVRTHGLVHLYRSEGHDVAALSGVDLDVPAGDVIGLLGPSGSGKSTLVSLIGGLFPPSAGRVLVGDVDVGAATARRLDDLRTRSVALVLQGAARNLLPYLDPVGNVAFAQVAARRAGVDLPPPEEILAAVGLGDQVSTPLARLTPGQLQLVAVAVAMARQPGLLLADEPTSQLDHEARDVVLDVVRRLNRDLGTTVLIVTHDPEVARRLPRTVTIRDGRIGGEGRRGEEFAVVTADGFLPLPAHARDRLRPGTLVRWEEVDGEFRLRVQGDDQPL